MKLNNFTVIVGEFLRILVVAAKQFTAVHLEVCIKFYVQRAIFLVNIQGSNDTTASSYS